MISCGVSGVFLSKSNGAGAGDNADYPPETAINYILLLANVFYFDSMIV